MKKILIILSLLSIVLNSCTWTNRADEMDRYEVPLTYMLESYDLWYVDINQTKGTGNVPFMSKAFTMSFMPNGEVYANNNMVGLGITGNGYGISIGTYNAYDYDWTLDINDDIYGRYHFEVSQISPNQICLYNRAENVTYYLIGYQQNEFDYDQLFYDNVTYFLQEYDAWDKTETIIFDPSELFNAENHLRFYVSGNENVFESSESDPNIPLSQIYWDYSGSYKVLNTTYNNRKELILYYNLNNTQEQFILSILEDDLIQLEQVSSGNIYRFKGHGYIQYKPNGKRLKLKTNNTLNKTYKK